MAALCDFPPEEDELFFDDEAYYDRMEAVLKRHRDVERSLPRGRSMSYAYLHGHKKKTTDDVLDDIEYYNSGRMAKACVDRLYKPRTGSPKAGGYLAKGSREAPEQKAKRVVPKIVTRGVVQNVKPRKAIEVKCEELHRNHELHKRYMENLRKEAEKRAEKPSKWKGEKLTEEQIKERVSLLYNVNFKKTTVPHIQAWVQANPPSAANYESYKQLSAFLGREIVPLPKEPLTYRNTPWQYSGRSSSSKAQETADKMIIRGTPKPPPPPNHFQNIVYDREFIFATTESVKHKRRSKSEPSTKKWL